MLHNEIFRVQLKCDNWLIIYVFLHLANQCNAKSIDNAWELNMYPDQKTSGDYIVVECHTGYSSNGQTQGPLVCDQNGDWQIKVACDGKRLG